MELIYTDAERATRSVLRKFSLDIEFGGDTATNDFRLTVGMGVSIDIGALIFIDGTEYGGIVDGWGVDYSGTIPKRTYTGRSWHGILYRKVVKPVGEHFTVSGDANACIASLMSHIGNSEVFRVVDSDSGIVISSYQFKRFCDAYSGLRNMLASVDARLSIVRERGYVWLSAVPATVSTETSATASGLKIEDNLRPVNHLICAGEGENEERVVVDLYADSEGNISQTQSLFGIDEVSELYSFTTADREQITEDGTDRLAEYQQSTEASMTIPADRTYTVGDVIKSRDAIAGSATAQVDTVTVTVDKDSISVSYSNGEAQASRNTYSGRRS